MSNLSFKRGIFKEELKNRFLCLVEVDGEDTLCYIPSSCRLSNFVSMAGKTVLLSPVAATDARTKYSVEALAVGHEFVLLNMSKANKVVIDNIHSRRFAILGKRSSIKKECTIAGYKSDLYIEDTKTVVEIKSILSFRGEAEFPSVYSQRAVDQLMKIQLKKICDEVFGYSNFVANLVRQSTAGSNTGTDNGLQIERNEWRFQNSLGQCGCAVLSQIG